MGLLTSFGKHVKGLLGDDAFVDRLAQAQAFANGDPATAARIAADIRRRRAPKAERPGGDVPRYPSEPTNYSQSQPGPFTFEFNDDPQDLLGVRRRRGYRDHA